MRSETQENFMQENSAERQTVALTTPTERVHAPAPSLVGADPAVWRTPGSLLLISCYELGHQPLGLAWPMAFLERAGYRPVGIDLAVESLDPAKVAPARFIGVSVPMHTALRLGVRAVRRLREINPNAHICFYGLYAALNAAYLLEHGADSVLSGEYEVALVDLVRAIEEGDMRAVHPTKPVLKRLPFPAVSRSALPLLSQYARLERDGGQGLAGYVEASRGCLHVCRHCPIPPVYAGRFFVIPPDVVLNDIRQLAAAGATHITFGDPDFLNGPRHALHVARALHAEFPHITFDFTAKVSHILKHRALFPELAALGCVFMVSAVESLSDRVLTYLDKGHTRADVAAALAVVQEAGIAMRPTWVPFTPWTTLGDYLKMLDFIEAHDLIDHVDPVQYSIRLLIPPGSLLLSQADLRPFLGPLDAENFSYRWTHPDPCMDNLQGQVRAALEEATRTLVDPALMFYRVRRLAQQAFGIDAPNGPPAFTRTKRPPPRLTENWFC